jgi:phosphatidylglycerophosphate synthase
MQKERRYKLAKVGLTGLVCQELSLVAVKYIPAGISANTVTAVGLLCASTVAFTIPKYPQLAGVAILMAVFLDFLDGTIARTRGLASEWGRIWDATTDVVLWLNIIVGLSYATRSPLPLILLAIYTLSVFWRYQLGHSTSLAEAPSAAYEQANNIGWLLKLKPYYSYFVNYLDSLSGLAVILIFFPEYKGYWLIYEFGRRVLLLLKLVRELFFIYRASVSRS